MPAFWTVRELSGAYKVEEIWGIDEPYLGLGQIVSIMDATLRSCESLAQKQYETYRKTHPEE